MDKKLERKTEDNQPQTLRLFDTVEAAQYLRLSVRTLEDYRLVGGGPTFIRNGRGKRAPVLYDLADLNAWILERKRLTTVED